MPHLTDHNKPLDTEAIVDFLRSRGKLDLGGRAPVLRPLAGGVSCHTVLIDTGSNRVVLKRALGRLRVERDWRAKPARAMTEADAIVLLHGLTPGFVPELLDRDPETNTIVIAAAPADWVCWKDALLEREPDPTSGAASVAAALGAVLGTWHRATWHDRAVAAQFDDYEAFDQLRVAPFHRTVAAAHPAVAATIDECSEELLTRRDCLVHGDFSPKNVLVGGTGLVVLDYEVAHFGAAVFDLAFMSCHLALKALHMPSRAAEMRAAAAAFVAGYQRSGSGSSGGVSRLGWHTACLLLARVDGLSPAGYLSPGVADTVRRLALAVLGDDDPAGPVLWDLVEDAATASADR